MTERKKPTRQVVDSLDLCFAAVSAIIERAHNGQWPIDYCTSKRQSTTIGLPEYDF